MAGIVGTRGRAEQQKDQNNPHHDRLPFSRLCFCAAAPFSGSMFTGLRRGPAPAPLSRYRFSRLAWAASPLAVALPDRSPAAFHDAAACFSPGQRGLTAIMEGADHVDESFQPEGRWER